MRTNYVAGDKRTTNKKPGTHIVISLIEVWKPKKALDFVSEPAFGECLRICECQSMVCKETYEQLIWEMDLDLPKGTIVHKTIHEFNKEDTDKQVKTHAVDGGAVVTTTYETKVADTSCFDPGMRIRVYTGYTTDPDIAKLNRLSLPSSDTIYGNEGLLNTYKNAMDLTFDGFISKCSPSAPFKIHAESVASILRKITCGKDKNAVNGCTLKDIFDPGGTWKLLEKTGIELHSRSTLQKLDNIGVIPKMRTTQTIADVLYEWSKQHHVYFRMQDDNGTPKLRVGYSFSSGFVSDSEDTPSIYGNGDDSVPVIYFDYNVAEDGLSYANVDRYSLAVKCIVNTIGDKGARNTYSFYVRLDPSGIDNAENSNFIVYDEKTVTKQDRKKQKAQGGKATFDHSGYTIIERLYPKPMKASSLDKNKLKAWAISQFEHYDKNGMDGTLTLFGDLAIHTGDIVELVDDQHSDRNGQYLVDDVTTRLSVNGLRQTIKLPYKIVAYDN